MAEAISKNELMARRIAVFLFFALAFIEFFIDPFPKSLWPLRILTTQYSAVVTANLTIDGEPLVLTRKIRCFDPLDYQLYPGAAPRTDVLSSNGQAGDTLAATTSKGRLFAINVPDACGALNKNGGNGMFLSRGDIETPVVFEIHGGKKATQIDAYIARDLLRTGYHGVQLNELIVDYSDAFQLIDWTGYDWFGPQKWYRHSDNNWGEYEVGYLMAAPEDRWNEIQSAYKNKHEAESDLNEVLDWTAYLRALTENRLFEGANLKRNIFQSYFYNATIFDNELILKKHGFSDDKAYNWLTHEVIPCVRAENEKQRICDSLKKGIMIYTPYTRIHLPLSFFLNSYEYAPQGTHALFFQAHPKVLYALKFGTQTLKGK